MSMEGWPCVDLSPAIVSNETRLQPVLSTWLSDMQCSSTKESICKYTSSSPNLVIPTSFSPYLPHTHKHTKPQPPSTQILKPTRTHVTTPEKEHPTKTNTPTQTHHYTNKNTPTKHTTAQPHQAHKHTNNTQTTQTHKPTRTHGQRQKKKKKTPLFLSHTDIHTYARTASAFALSLAHAQARALWHATRCSWSHAVTLLCSAHAHTPSRSRAYIIEMLYSRWFALSTALTAHLVSGDKPPQCEFCIVYTDDPDIPKFELVACSTNECQELTDELKKKTGAFDCGYILNSAGCSVLCDYHTLPDQKIKQVSRKYC